MKRITRQSPWKRWRYQARGWWRRWRSPRRVVIYLRWKRQHARYLVDLAARDAVRRMKEDYYQHGKNRAERYNEYLMWRGTQRRRPSGA